MAHILEAAFEAAALEQKEKEVEKQNKAPAVASTMPMDQDSIPPPMMGETDAATDKRSSDFKATAPDLHLNPQASPIDAVNVPATASNVKGKSPDSLPTDPAASVSFSPVFATSHSPDQKDKRKRPATRSTPSPGVKAKKKRPATTSSPSPGSKKKKENPPAAGSTNKSSIQSGIDLDALVGMTLFDKNDFHRGHRTLHRHSQPYLDHAYDIVLDFRKCDMRVLHFVHEPEPDKKGAESDDEKKKGNGPDLSKQQTEVGIKVEGHRITFQ